MWRGVNAQHSTLTSPENGWDVRNGSLFSLLSDQKETADLLGDEHSSVGQESDLPRQVKRRDLIHIERQVGVRLLLACVDLCRYARRAYGKKQPRGYQVLHPILPLSIERLVQVIFLT